MTARRSASSRCSSREAYRLILGLAVVYFALSAANLALYERILGRATVSQSGSTARLDPVALHASATGADETLRPPAASGELAQALSRVQASMGDVVMGRRLDNAAHLAVEDLARLVGGEIYRAPEREAATLITPAGLITLDARGVSRRNYTQLGPEVVPVSVDGRLYVPLRALGSLAGASLRRDEAGRCWQAKLGGRETTVVMPEDLFEIEIDRSDRLLRVSYGGAQLVQWSACVGAGGNTPVGVFHVRNKAVWPPWTAYWGEYMPGGSARNPLGARWLGTSAHGSETGRSIGIHGTNQPSSIGRRISGGCVRLTNAHAIELYDTIPIGTRVTIHE